MFDPPEYVNWKAESGIIDEFENTLKGDPDRARIIADVSEKQLVDMYSGLLRFRLHDITLRRWVKQGILAKAWLGTGEEAVTIGNVHALDRSIDKVGPMIRNAGACHEMGISLADMLREYLATADSPSQGKDLHLGRISDGVIAPASQVAALTPVFAGMALAIKQRGEKAVFPPGQAREDGRECVDQHACVSRRRCVPSARTTSIPQRPRSTNATTPVAFDHDGASFARSARGTSRSPRPFA